MTLHFHTKVLLRHLRAGRWAVCNLFTLPLFPLLQCMVIRGRPTLRSLYFPKDRLCLSTAVFLEHNRTMEACLIQYTVPTVHGKQMDNCSFQFNFSVMCVSVLWNWIVKICKAGMVYVRLYKSTYNETGINNLITYLYCTLNSALWHEKCILRLFET